MAYVRLNIAVDKNLSKEKKQELESKGMPTADFINVVAWGKLAENISNYTAKGLKILIQGNIQTGSYEKDGQKVYTTDVLASNVEFIDWKSSNNNSSSSVPTQDDFNYSNDFKSIEDSRIPF